MVMSMEVVFDDVSLRFADKNIFSSLNIRFKSHKITLIKGANGSGKSTLLKLAAHILSPDFGKVFISDGDKHLKGREYQTQIAMLSPDMKLYENLTPSENLRFFLGLRGIKPQNEEISKLWRRVNLKEEELKNKFSANLSTGMNQRVKFAILLAVDSPVWLMDEPAANLDEAGRNIIINEAKRAAAKGKTILWATNDEREFKIADDIVDLNKAEDIT